MDSDNSMSAFIRLFSSTVTLCSPRSPVVPSFQSLICCGMAAAVPEVPCCLPSVLILTYLLPLCCFCSRSTLFANYQPITSRTFTISLLVEFLGVMIFSFLGTTVNDKVRADAERCAHATQRASHPCNFELGFICPFLLCAIQVHGPWVNGLALAIMGEHRKPHV